MQHIINEIARTAEHAAIYRSVAALMRGHSTAGTLAVGAVIVVVAVLLQRAPRRGRR